MDNVIEQFLSKSTSKRIRAHQRATTRYQTMRQTIEECGNKFLEIPYPRLSEAEIQADLWNKLRNLGYDAKLEVRYSFKDFVNKFSKKQRKRQLCRFDIVVFKNKKAIAIIEVKSGNKHWNTKVSNKQIAKYSKFNCELLFCIGDSQIQHTIAKIHELIGV